MVDDVESLGAFVGLRFGVRVAFAQLAGAHAGAGKLIRYEKGIQKQEEADAYHKEKDGEETGVVPLQRFYFVGGKKEIIQYLVYHFRWVRDGPVTVFRRRPGHASA